jgi:hypothetical protein
MAKTTRVPKDEQGDIERVLKAAKLPISQNNGTGFVVRRVPSMYSRGLGKAVKGFIGLRWDWDTQIEQGRVRGPGTATTVAGKSSRRLDAARDKYLARAGVALARAGIDVEFVDGSTPGWKIENRGPIPGALRDPERRVGLRRRKM